MVTAPILIIVSGWDKVTPIEGAQELFRRLPYGPDKRLVEIGSARSLVGWTSLVGAPFRTIFLDSPASKQLNFVWCGPDQRGVFRYCIGKFANCCPNCGAS
jgi:hypothetical protein